MTDQPETSITTQFGFQTLQQFRDVYGDIPLDVPAIRYISQKAQPMFITFEGIDGSGKTTQLQLLAQHLRDTHDVEVVTTREPGGSAVGQLIRDILLGDTGRSTEIDPYTQVMLFAADRIAHMEQIIKPALQRGAWVLCDRWEDSTRAYQGAGNQLTDNHDDTRFIETLNTMSRRHVVPHATLLFDIPAEVSAARVTGRGETKDRFEQQDLDFRQRVRTAYLQLHADPVRQRDWPMVLIQAEDTIENIHAVVQHTINHITRDAVVRLNTVPRP